MQALFQIYETTAMEETRGKCAQLSLEISKNKSQKQISNNYIYISTVL